MVFGGEDFAHNLKPENLEPKTHVSLSVSLFPFQRVNPSFPSTVSSSSFPGLFLQSTGVAALAMPNLFRLLIATRVEEKQSVQVAILFEAILIGLKKRYFQVANMSVTWTRANVLDPRVFGTSLQLCACPSQFSSSTHIRHKSTGSSGRSMVGWVGGLVLLEEQP